MNKAFVREPDDDGRGILPALRIAGGSGRERAARYAHPSRVTREDRDSAWFCNYPRCEAAYFNQFDAVVTADE